MTIHDIYQKQVIEKSIYANNQIPLIDCQDGKVKIYFDALITPVSFKWKFWDMTAKKVGEIVKDVLTKIMFTGGNLEITISLDLFGHIVMEPLFINS
jgi:hypothetical protein